MAPARARGLAFDSLSLGVWIPALVITAVNIGLFWVLLSTVGGR